MPEAIITAEYITQDPVWNSRIVVTRWARDGNRLTRVSSKTLINMKGVSPPVKNYTGEYALLHADYVELANPKPAAWGISGWEFSMITENEAIRLEAESAERTASILAAKAEAYARYSEAMVIVRAIPAAASKELRTLNAEANRRASFVNEGEEGYVPSYDWSRRTGREILVRHGVDPDAIAAAFCVLEERLSGKA